MVAATLQSVVVHSTHGHVTDLATACLSDSKPSYYKSCCALFKCATYRAYKAATQPMSQQSKQERRCHDDVSQGVRAREGEDTETRLASGDLPLGVEETARDEGSLCTGEGRPQQGCEGLQPAPEVRPCSHNPLPRGVLRAT